jgi:hypothetical protein
MMSIISPKSMFLKLADVFMGKEVQQEVDNQPSQLSNSHLPSPHLSASKMNINLQDLKIISTALLHYKRSLAKLGEAEKAESVGHIDKRFYEMISSLETWQDYQKIPHLA